MIKRKFTKLESIKRAKRIVKKFESAESSRERLLCLVDKGAVTAEEALKACVASMSEDDCGLVIQMLANAALEDRCADCDEDDSEEAIEVDDLDELEDSEEDETEDADEIEVEEEPFEDTEDSEDEDSDDEESDKEDSALEACNKLESRIRRIEKLLNRR